MNLVLQNAQVWLDGRFRSVHVFIREGMVSELSNRTPQPDEDCIDCMGYHIFPGFADVHVHLREPGFSMKETIKTGTLAAARGGFSAVCAMPNVNPMPDCLKGLEKQLDIIREQAVIQVLPLGTITKGEKGEELSDMAAMAPKVAGFSDDGRGVQQDQVMLAAMKMASSLNQIIVAHCEEESLVKGGVANPSAFSRCFALPENAPESEFAQVKRDLDLLRQVGGRYHACHLSTRQSVELIRQAKQEGLDVSCETAPHYLLLDDGQLENHGRFKMNPPIRAKEDREALLAGLIDGTVDMVATDHAPHTQEEKDRGFLQSPFGVVGLETAFPLLYHHLVLTGKLSLARLVEALHDAPSLRFGLRNAFVIGQPANLSVWDLQKEYQIDPAEFVSLGKATPFLGWPATGRCLMTMSQGRVAYQEGI